MWDPPDCDWYQRANGQYSWVYKDTYDGQDGPSVDSENNTIGRKLYVLLTSNYFYAHAAKTMYNKLNVKNAFIIVLVFGLVGSV